MAKPERRQQNSMGAAIVVSPHPKKTEIKNRARSLD
jgi:hypothetical protein